MTAVETLIQQLEGTLTQPIYERLEREGLFTKALKDEKEQRLYDYRQGIYDVNTQLNEKYYR